MPAPQPSPALPAFVREGAADYRWDIAAPARSAPEATVHTLRLQSQVWRGHPWTHRLHCVIPSTVNAATPAAAGCLLHITGSGEHPSELAPLQDLAVRLGAPVAILQDVPNQPLFGDLREDALIAHTFERFLEDGDTTWPLLLPMTRAAVRAMDALEAFLPGQARPRPEGFVVTGASKRGWTTYLTAAVDPRVRAIAPMVYDNLDIPAQLHRQREVFGGGYSPEIADYTDRGLQERLEAPEGAGLLALVDPFAHRARLTMPKWLLLGTNDPYWPVDALSLYLSALPGPTFVTYTPNAGHGLGQTARIVTALAALWNQAFPDQTGTGTPTPLSAEWLRHADRTDLRVWGPQAVSSARVWAASRPTLDFREAQWRPVADLAGGPPWTASIPTPDGQYVAAFAELEIPGPGGPIPLDTPIRLLGQADAREG